MINILVLNYFSIFSIKCIINARGLLSHRIAEHSCNKRQLINKSSGSHPNMHSSSLCLCQSAISVKHSTNNSFQELPIKVQYRRTQFLFMAQTSFTNCICNHICQHLAPNNNPETFFQFRIINTISKVQTLASFNNLVENASLILRNRDDAIRRRPFCNDDSN